MKRSLNTANFRLITVQPASVWFFYTLEVVKELLHMNLVSTGIDVDHPRLQRYC